MTETKLSAHALGEMNEPKDDEMATYCQDRSTAATSMENAPMTKASTTQGEIDWTTVMAAEDSPERVMTRSYIPSGDPEVAPLERIRELPFKHLENKRNLSPDEVVKRAALKDDMLDAMETAAAESDASQYSELLCYLWHEEECGCADHDVWRQRWSSKLVTHDPWLEGDEPETFALLPPQLQIYRGIVCRRTQPDTPLTGNEVGGIIASMAGGREGLSWTVDVEMARFFAQRGLIQAANRREWPEAWVHMRDQLEGVKGDGNCALVLQGSVAKEDVRAYMGGSEQEVVVFSEAVTFETAWVHAWDAGDLLVAPEGWARCSRV